MHEETTSVLEGGTYDLAFFSEPRMMRQKGHSGRGDLRAHSKRGHNDVPVPDAKSVRKYDDQQLYKKKRVKSADRCSDVQMYCLSEPHP